MSQAQAKTNVPESMQLQNTVPVKDLDNCLTSVLINPTTNKITQQW